jgi:hypothetical protein
MIKNLGTKITKIWELLFPDYYNKNSGTKLKKSRNKVTKIQEQSYKNLGTKIQEQKFQKFGNKKYKIPRTKITKI